MHASPDAEFDQFWAAYPRKTAKGDARKAWDGARRRVPDLLARSLVALGWQCRQSQWCRDDGAYVPYPATWLRAERWDDEPQTASASYTAEEVANFYAWQRANGEEAKVITIDQFMRFQQARRRA